MSDNKPMRLGDIVEGWLQDHRVLGAHLEIEHGASGFYVNMKCGPLEENPAGPMSIIFFNDSWKGLHHDWNGWLHEMDPFDPQYFVKFEKLMYESHNRLAAESGCKQKL